MLIYARNEHSGVNAAVYGAVCCKFLLPRTINDKGGQG
jgi:hypothetical protein